jgi:hypothetical protein
VQPTGHDLVKARGRQSTLDAKITSREPIGKTGGMPPGELTPVRQGSQPHHCAFNFAARAGNYENPLPLRQKSVLLDPSGEFRV